MRYKLYDEIGEYKDKTTGEDRNLVYCEIAHTPEGVNVGWDEFSTIEEAINYYNIELKVMG